MAFKDQAKWQKKNRFANLNDHYRTSNPNAVSNNGSVGFEFDQYGSFVIMDDPLAKSLDINAPKLNITTEKLKGHQLKKVKKELAKDYAPDAW